MRGKIVDSWNTFTKYAAMPALPNGRLLLDIIALSMFKMIKLIDRGLLPVNRSGLTEFC
jgi:hypothetical protein